MLRFIIEHPMRGVLLESSEVGEPRFSPSASRVDERVKTCYSLPHARRALEVFTNDRTRPACKIMKRGHNDIEWKEVG